MHAAAAGRFEQASRHLSAALREWRGPVLDDLRDFQFVEPFATALVEDKVLAHTAKAEAEIACGRASAVIAELEALTFEHPYREPPDTADHRLLPSDRQLMRWAPIAG